MLWICSAAAAGSVCCSAAAAVAVEMGSALVCSIAAFGPGVSERGRARRTPRGTEGHEEDVLLYRPVWPEPPAKIVMSTFVSIGLFWPALPARCAMGTFTSTGLSGP